MGTTLPSLPQAIATANGWVEAARPLIRAYIKIADVQCDIACDCDPDIQWESGRANKAITKAFGAVRDEIESIRDSRIADISWRWREGLTEAEVEAGDAFNDALNEGVTSADAAINNIADEPFAAIRRAA